MAYSWALVRLKTSSWATQLPCELNWVLCHPPSHEVEHACQHSVLRWKWNIGATQVLEAHVCYMKWPKCPWSLLLLPLPSLPQLLLWPQGVFLMISGREDLGLLCRCSTYGTFAGTTQKWTGAALQPLPGTSLKDSGEGKSSQEAGLQAMHPVVLPAWTEEWPDVLLCPVS